jgi:hypothetical protein
LELKVDIQEHSCLDVQLLALKVESQQFSSTFYITFFYLFYVDWIDVDLHSFGLIFLVNSCVFQVSSKNKINLVLIDVPFNLSILHVSKMVSFILLRNKQVDNFIESIVIFVDMFLFDRKTVTIMHVDDPPMLKEICSFQKATS